MGAIENSVVLHKNATTTLPTRYVFIAIKSLRLYKVPHLKALKSDFDIFSGQTGQGCCSTFTCLRKYPFYISLRLTSLIFSPVSVSAAKVIRENT